MNMLFTSSQFRYFGHYLPLRKNETALNSHLHCKFFYLSVAKTFMYEQNHALSNNGN